MKHWTEHALQKLLEQPFQERVEKAPFPGQFPTRIYFKARNFSYFGKPSYRAYTQIRNCLMHDYYDFKTVEFDREGPFFYTWRSRAGRTATHLSEVWQAYHPHQNADYALSWMGYQFHLGKGGWYVVGKGAE